MACMSRWQRRKGNSRWCIRSSLQDGEASWETICRPFGADPVLSLPGLTPRALFLRRFAAETWKHSVKLCWAVLMRVRVRAPNRANLNRSLAFPHIAEQHPRMPRCGMGKPFGCAALALSAFLVSCGGGGAIHVSGTTPPAAAHVIVVVEENHSYSQVIGNSSMPYLNGLASQYGLATQYFGDVHPSIGNYLMLTTGIPETLNDGFTGTISDDNVVRELVKANKSWRSYAESLPSVGYVGGDVYPYLRHHNPFTYFTDVNGTSQASNLVPFSQFAADVNSGNLPDY